MNFKLFCSGQDGGLTHMHRNNDWNGSHQTGRHPTGNKRLEAVAAWVRAAHGATALPVALRKLGEVFDAPVVRLCRLRHADPARPQYVVSHDATANLSEAGAPASCAAAVLGPYLGTAREGSIWPADTQEFHDLPRLQTALRARRLGATVVVPICQGPRVSDYLEMHFAHPLSGPETDEIEALAAILSEAWKDRAPGILLTTVERDTRRGPAAARPDTADPLAMANPYRLSRAEYRVCLLLRQGLTRDGLQGALAISRSTLNTHLQNIYAKTGVPSQADLVHLLMRDAAGHDIRGRAAHVA